MLQPDELESACAEAGKDKAALENGEHDRFTGIPPITTRRSNSIRSDISEPSAPPLSLQPFPLFLAEEQVVCLLLGTMSLLYANVHACPIVLCGRMRVADLGMLAGGDDDAFYSPKSSASFSSDASFVSTTEHLGRSPFEDDSDLRRASSGPVSFHQNLQSIA